jgi:UDP-glucose 4-epimerase
MTVLVTGGAGYIGSHTVAELIAHGEEVVVIDNLRQGHREAVVDAPFYQVDIQDTEQVGKILREHNVDTVVHFAANSLVGESVRKPLDYYHNNVSGTAKLLSAMVENHVRNIVFSSTAAVYGEPVRTPILEDDPTVPTNPYGETKLAIERMFRWCHEAYGLNSVSLRYFNAAGAHPELPIGEDHNPETHLIPIVLQTALGQREHVSIFGNDYPTPDGTCIRDYIHVMDLASAHRLAVQRLRNGGGVEAFNLGNGTGFSVQQVIEVAREVTGRKIPAVYASRRAGDPAVLVASSDKAKRVLGWQPQYTNLADIVASAWRWHESHPRGYRY